MRRRGWIVVYCVLIPFLFIYVTQRPSRFECLAHCLSVCFFFSVTFIDASISSSASSKQQREKLTKSHSELSRQNSLSSEPRSILKKTRSVDNVPAPVYALPKQTDSDTCSKLNTNGSQDGRKISDNDSGITTESPKISNGLTSVSDDGDVLTATFSIETSVSNGVTDQDRASPTAELVLPSVDNYEPESRTVFTLADEDLGGESVTDDVEVSRSPRMSRRARDKSQPDR